MDRQMQFRRAVHFRAVHRPGRALRCGFIALLLALAGCVTAPPQPVGSSPDTVRGDITRRMPANLSDRPGWASDIQTAFAAQDIPPIQENICAVLAVIEQESGYQADPEVVNLPAIARGETEQAVRSLTHSHPAATPRPLRRMAGEGISIWCVG